MCKKQAQEAPLKGELTQALKTARVLWGISGWVS